jgi:hypothetical protein
MTAPALAPMEAKLVSELPEETGWQFEPKWDGFRALVFRDGDDIEISSKLGKSLARYFPEIVALVAGISQARFVLDGELILPIGDTLSFDALQARLASGAPVVLAGDFNVMPTERDVYKPERWTEDALFAPEVRAAFSRLTDQGWTDALRTIHPDETIYTFFDYFRNAYGHNAGLRIDHLLLSPALADRLIDAQVDRDVRGWEKTSDHAPVWIQLADEAKSRSKPTRKRKAT